MERGCPSCGRMIDASSSKCPYCNYEFQTDYDEDINEIPCPECGRIIEIDWSDNEEDDED